jgi:hypothetical protein
VQAPKEPRAAIGRDHRTDRSRPALELDEEIRVGGWEITRRNPGPPLGHEVEAFEETRWQHRPDDNRRWREVVIRDPASERQAERRQQRPVRADARDNRLEADPVGWHGVGEDDRERLSSAEFDEDGFARDEIRKGSWDAVGVGPGAAATGRVDRDLDDPPGGALSRRSPRSGFGDQTRTRRSGSFRCSSAMISSIRAAVRST